MFTNKDYAMLSSIDVFKNKEQSKTILKLIDKDARLVDYVKLRDGLSARIFAFYDYLTSNDTYNERLSINNNLKEGNKLCMKQVLCYNIRSV